MYLLHFFCLVFQIAVVDSRRAQQEIKIKKSFGSLAGVLISLCWLRKGEILAGRQSDGHGQHWGILFCVQCWLWLTVCSCNGLRSPTPHPSFHNIWTAKFWCPLCTTITLAESCNDQYVLCHVVSNAFDLQQFCFCAQLCRSLESSSESNPMRIAWPSSSLDICVCSVVQTGGANI